MSDIVERLDIGDRQHVAGRVLVMLIPSRIEGRCFGSLVLDKVITGIFVAK